MMGSSLYAMSWANSSARSNEPSDLLLLLLCVLVCSGRGVCLAGLVVSCFILVFGWWLVVVSDNAVTNPHASGGVF